jgi:4,5-dihydroxyphthalate decarboxylase
MALDLSLSCYHADLTKPLMDGEVQPAGIDLTTIEEYPPRRHRRFIRHGEFDVCEVSLASYLASRADPESYPFTAIPVYPEKKFRHSFFYKHADTDVEGPADLAGRKVGIQSWQTTANVWIRGIAQEHYGLDLESVIWYRRKEDDVLAEVPDRFDVRPLGGDAVSDPSSLREAFFDGELAAAMDPAGGMFNAVAESDDAEFMWEDPVAEECRYFEETGIHPPMHVVAIRDEVLENHPWVATSIFDAFCASRDRCLEWNTSPASHSSLTWSHLHRHHQREALGEDVWEFGLTEKTRRELSKFVEYAHDQGIAEREYDLEELFVDTTLDL